MPSFKLSKLVRTGVFASMEKMGQQVTHTRLNDEALIVALSQKLVEEAAEFNPTEPSALEELADVQEVLDILAYKLGSSPEAVRALQREKRAKLGGFDEGIFVEQVSLAPDDPYVSYYEAHPERFKPL